MLYKGLPRLFAELAWCAATVGINACCTILGRIVVLLLYHRGLEPIDAGAPCAAVRVH